MRVEKDIAERTPEDGDILDNEPRTWNELLGSEKRQILHYYCPRCKKQLKSTVSYETCPLPGCGENYINITGLTLEQIEEIKQQKHESRFATDKAARLRIRKAKWE